MTTLSSGNSDVADRIKAAFTVIFVCYGALLVRLFYLQGLHGAEIRAQAIRERRHTITLPAHRGSIYDRNGKVLAASVFSGKVGFDAKSLFPEHPTTNGAKKFAKRLDASIMTVSHALNMPEAKVRDLVEKARVRYDADHAKRYVTVATDVPPRVAAAISGAHPPLLGFGVKEGSRRLYTCAECAPHVVGVMGHTRHANMQEIGVLGIERSYEPWLEGKDGSAVCELDDRRRQLPGTMQRITPARDGYDIVTTLDATAQEYATEEARHICEQYHPKGVSVVIVDPTNGDVLALVSMPTFDPNPGPHRKLSTALMTERCASMLYEPGSTLKALTIAAALDAGAITTHSHYNCTGQFAVGRGIIHCSLHGKEEAHGHGYQDPEAILRHSCNIAAAQIAMHLGPKRLYAYDTAFGLFSPLNIGLPAEQHGRLFFDRRENIMSMGKVARVGFGHAITTTPVHLCMAYAALANGGVLMKPRLVSAIKDGNGKIVREFAPKQIRRVVKPETASTLCRMLRAVVANGTGKVAAVPGYVVAGKTGTANKYRKGKYIGSFIGVLPASMTVKPRAVILVAVDEPTGGTYYGAEVAAPAFQQIATRLMSAWHVPEDDPRQTQAAAAAANLRRAGHTTIPFTLRVASNSSRSGQ